MSDPTPPIYFQKNEALKRQNENSNLIKEEIKKKIKEIELVAKDETKAKNESMMNSFKMVIEFSYKISY
jgi:hypothetical protein